MLGIEPRKTGLGVSLLYPFSGTGLLLVSVLTAYLGLLRFLTWLFSKGEPGLSGAGVVIFAVLGAAYAARGLTASVEASAEGYDVAPSLPDPREVETLFGALLSVVSVLFFALAPSLLAALFGIFVPPLSYALLGLAVLYFPLGLLGVSVRGEPTGGFPSRVLAGVAATFGRYLGALLLSGGAVFLLALTRSGPLARWPLALLVALDAAAAWLLLAMAHRVGAMHREEFILSSLMPLPEPEVISSEDVLPRRPMTEIERILAEREKRD